LGKGGSQTKKGWEPLG